MVNDYVIIRVDSQVSKKIQDPRVLIEPPGRFVPEFDVEPERKLMMKKPKKRDYELIIASYCVGLDVRALESTKGLQSLVESGLHFVHDKPNEGQRLAYHRPERERMRN